MRGLDKDCDSTIDIQEFASRFEPVFTRLNLKQDVSRDSRDGVCGPTYLSPLLGRFSLSTTKTRGVYVRGSMSNGSVGRCDVGRAIEEVRPDQGGVQYTTRGTRFRVFRRTSTTCTVVAATCFTECRVVEQNAKGSPLFVNQRFHDTRRPYFPQSRRTSQRQLRAGGAASSSPPRKNIKWWSSSPSFSSESRFSEKADHK